MVNENFCVARVETRTSNSIGKFERHIERKNEEYKNMNVDLSRTPMNQCFKNCGDLSYNEYLNQLVDQGKVSLRGLKSDAKIFDEMILDVNTDYFEQNGGYEYACEFYEEALHFAEEFYGRENIVSAVMHADEQNSAMTEKYGRPIYHYHLHIVALPVVDKEIKWTKRCKDPALVGTVKEVVHQISHSKKWKSEKILDENGNPVLNKKGKPTFRPSYSILQDKFYEHMVGAGFTGFQRGEKGSTAEHLSVTEFKVEKEQERLDALTEQTQQKEQKLESLDSRIEKIQKQKVEVAAIEQISSKPVPMTSKVMIEKTDFDNLLTIAKKHITQERKERKLQKMLDAANQKIQELTARVKSLTEELFQFKSVRKILNPTELEKENQVLRDKVQKYDEIIEKNMLWSIFHRTNENSHSL